MTSRERILTALKGGTPDRVPINEYLFSLKLQKEIMGYNTELYEGRTQVKMAAKLGLDAVWIPVNGFCGLEEEPHEQRTEYKDEWGVTYKKNGWPIMAQINAPIKTQEDWNNYSLPDVNASFRLNILKDAIKANDDDLAILFGILGPFTMLSWYFMDFTSLSMAMFTEPDLVKDINKAYIKWILEVCDLAHKTGGVDVFHISDDWGGSNGLLISPDHFREFFTEPFKELVQGLQKYDIPVIMHNDGKIWDVLDDLVDTGINAYHPVEKAAGMDMKLVREKYSNNLCLIGNINNKDTMVSGTPEEVKQETIDCLKTGGMNGGYIISTDHSLHDDMPSENVYTFIKTAKEYGKYPLEF